MPIPPILPPVIAHRGASTEAPENTLSALKLAAQSGTEWVEFDVKLTHDGVPILMHDETFERTTNGTGNVADMDWAEVQKLDAGSKFDSRFRGEPVPHLAEALHCMLDAGLRPMIEIKPCPGRSKATAMVTLIEAAKLWPHDHASPMILSFDREALTVATQLQPQWPRAFSIAEWTKDWLEFAKQIGAEAIVIDADIITRERMIAMSQNKLAVLAYTVNDAVRAKQLFSNGVSAVFSDNAKAIIKAL